MADSTIATALGRVTQGLAAGEDRPSQLRMAEAVAAGVTGHRHLVVQAGTGTGKSMGYLVPLLTVGARVVVATATKALQDQLATRDLPLLTSRLGAPFTYAVLKGRTNYLCRQRADEISGHGADQLTLDGAAAGGTAAPGPLGREVTRLIAWAQTAETGDRADLPWEPTATAWAQVSVGPRDCPGRTRCPSGESCFAEAARDRAAAADVVVVNTHLYAAHLGSGGEVLPPHDVVVVDEAHELEDIASASLGFELAPGRLHALARTARPLLSEAEASTAVDDAASLLADALLPHRDARLAHPLDATLAEHLGVVRDRVSRLVAAVRAAGRSSDGAPGRGDDSGRRRRTQQAATHLLTDIDAILELSGSSAVGSRVGWVEGPAHSPVLRVAPVDIGATLSALLWQPDGAPTAILTSATIPPRLGARIGLPEGSYDELDVGSPFDYQTQALLYCAMHLPDPRAGGYETAMLDELVALIEAAGGRTLALFTSWRAMQSAAAQITDRVGFTVLTQADLPKPALVARFAGDEQSCLFATMGFWQGVDIPGPALSLVVMDRLPFPRPDDPLLQARRELLGRGAFKAIDVPRAATLLAQGAGRLIRTATDRGVVAVLDPRLGTAGYRWDLVRALPPMRRTRHRDEVVSFLTPLRAGNPAGRVTVGGPQPSAG